MSRKKKIIISVSIIGLFLISLAISYAYFSAVIYNNENTSTIVGRAAYLELTFEDGSPEISASDIIPGWSATKTFKVENTGDRVAYYKLKIKDISNPLVSGGLSYEITSNDGGENISKRLVLTRTRDISLPIEIGVGEEHNYTITTYYDSIDVDQSNDLGKSFKYTIGIESVKELMGKPLHWDNPGENTLLAAIKENYPKAEAPETIPGVEINVKEEALLSATEDDYGVSYYLRGNVQNNYVVFANKCWKIVRIDGNGNIKLWLWNNVNNCSNDNAILRNLRYSVNANHNAYIGFMYGDINSEDFATPEETGVHDNLHDSTILTSIKNWYDTAFETSTTNNYTDLLADVIWCNDKKLVSGTGIGNVNSTYGINARKSKPSLVCQDAIENDVNNISRFTAYKNTDINNAKGNGKLKTAIDNTNPVEYKYYKAGLITADEAVFAGSAPADYWWTNNNFYLGKSVSWFLTMTPNDTNLVYYLHPKFIWSAGMRDYLGNSFRPTIALIPSVTLTNTPNQDGTATHPFEIAIS